MYLVKDWEERAHYAIWASCATVRAFQTIEEKDNVELRVLVGDYGFEQTFKDINDAQFCEIVKFCGAKKFLDVGKTVPNEIFTVKIAEKPQEIQELLEAEFEHVCQKENLIFLRKRK